MSTHLMTKVKWIKQDTNNREAFLLFIVANVAAVAFVDVVTKQKEKKNNKQVQLFGNNNIFVVFYFFIENIYVCA